LQNEHFEKKEKTEGVGLVVSFPTIRTPPLGVIVK
jgi:hypothetical protein